jgi:hypothetical protein
MPTIPALVVDREIAIRADEFQHHARACCQRQA